MPPKRKIIATGEKDPATNNDMEVVQFLRCTEGNSDKFYELSLKGTTVISRYGRYGSNGATSIKEFDTIKDCMGYITTVSTEKLKKGYSEEKPSTVTKDLKRVKCEMESSINIKAPNEGVPIEDNETFYLECKEGSSCKFYELRRTADKVRIRYGRIGTDGVSSEKIFDNDIEAAKKFVAKSMSEKEKKGYGRVMGPEQSGAAAEEAQESTAVSSGNLAEDLENGLKVYIKGSSALPYTLKKFNGGYSCSCLGWSSQIRLRGIQAASCKHLKEVRGIEAEAERCMTSAGVAVPSGNKNASIPGKISLAQQWKTSIDPTGYIMSEKLDGMRAYWCGKKLWSRSGLPIVAPDWFLSGLPADLALDGELFLGRGQFDECMSIARRTDASGDWRQLRYVVFDAPTVKGGILDRLARAEDAFQRAASSLVESSELLWKLHPQTRCLGMEHLLDELAKIEALDGEGLMLRSATAAHRGGRSSDLLKVKSFHDDEALVTAHEEGRGKYQGQVGSLVCVLRSGARFKVGSGLTDAMRGNKQAPAPGTVIMFKYFELTKDGIPRFPTFVRIRPDVSPSEFSTAT